MRKLWKNKFGAVTPETIVVIVLAFLVLAYVGPIAISTIVNANTASWNSTVKTIFQVLLPIIFVIGMAILFIKHGKGG